MEHLLTRETFVYFVSTQQHHNLVKYIPAPFHIDEKTKAQSEEMSSQIFY